jgi:hypothetical protein
MFFNKSVLFGFFIFGKERNTHVLTNLVHNLFALKIQM